MRMRKLFAGLAAAATLLGGLALGTAPASAADGDAFADGITFGHTITIHSDEYSQFKKSDGSLRDFAYVKIADYVSDGYTGVALQTVDTLKGEIAQQLMEWQPGYPAGSGKDPLTWLSEQGEATYRKFVEGIEAGLKPESSNITNIESGNTTASAPTAKLDSYFNNLTIDFGADKGLYLIYDLSGDQTFSVVGGGTQTIHAMKTAMVGTSIEGAVVQPDNATGKVEAKGQNSTFDSNFEFTKIDREHKTLEGAEFEIRYASGEHQGEPVKFQKTEIWYKAVAFDTTEGSTNKVISDQNGNIQIKGLQPGWYTVTETKAPAGYTDKWLPSFKIMVNNQGIVSSYIGKEDGDPYDLVQNDATMGLVVVNLLPSELPQTGAAGTVLFSVIALLLAGTAGTVYMKSRATKRALNA